MAIEHALATAIIALGIDALGIDHRIVNSESRFLAPRLLLRFRTLEFSQASARADGTHQRLDTSHKHDVPLDCGPQQHPTMASHG